MRIAFLLLFMALPAATQAQQVYKCSDGHQVVYQSQPCEGSQRTVRQWDASPAPVASASQTIDAAKKIKPGTARPGERRTTAGNNRRTPTDYDRKVSRCEAAKARREAKLKAVGLKRTFDLLRKLDDAVYEACQ